LGRVDGGALEYAAGFVDGAGDQRSGDPVEFVSGEVQGVVSSGDLYRGARGAGEHFLGGADLGPECLPVAAFCGGFGVVEPAPEVGVA
jgi:hypothetical protein